MKIYDYGDINKLYVIGDIHGEFHTLFNKIKKRLSYDKNEFVDEIHPLVKKEIEEREAHNELRPFNMDNRINIRKILEESNNLNNSVIIVCGDCGFGFNKHQYYIDNLAKANELFSKTNTHIIFVRGNHDDPSYFESDLIGYSNLKCVPDYSVVITKEYKTLCVGGAISVDRIWRKQQEHRINRFSTSSNKRLYWENENVIFNENLINELKELKLDINSVVTHSAPSFTFPFNKPTSLDWFKVDDKLKKDLETERNILDNIFSMLKSEFKIEFWAYGHFHLQWDGIIEGIPFLANADDFFFKSPKETSNRLFEMEKMKEMKKAKRVRIHNPNEEVIPNIPNNEILINLHEMYGNVINVDEQEAHELPIEDYNNLLNEENPF